MSKAHAEKEVSKILSVGYCVVPLRKERILYEGSRDIPYNTEDFSSSFFIIKIKKMTRIRVTYIAIDDEGAPIASAETQEHLKKALDIYYGVEKGAAKCEGWFPFQTEYPDDYEGYYEYSWCMVLRDVIDEGKDMVKVYCIDFHPYTEYDIKQAQTIRKNRIVELSDESWEGCDGCTEQDEVMYKNGYVKGYNAAIAELPKELSDEEIKEKMFGGQFDDQDDDDLSMLFGAKWYREQLKQRQ